MKKTIALSGAILTAVAAVSLAQVGPAYGQAQQSAQQQQQAQQRQQQAQQREQQQDQRTQQGQSGQQNVGNIQKAQEDYVKAAASDNQYEIQAGQFVEQHAQDQQVKQLAQKLAQDHSQAQQQLEQTAQQAHITLSKQLTPVQQAMWEALQKMQGPELDRCFTFQTVGGHETDILMSQWVAEHAQDPNIKQYAQQMVPALQQHLKMAMQTAEQFVPQAKMAGARMQGTQSQTNGSGSSPAQQPNNNGQ